MIADVKQTKLRLITTMVEVNRDTSLFLKFVYILFWSLNCFFLLCWLGRNEGFEVSGWRLIDIFTFYFHFLWQYREKFLYKSNYSLSKVLSDLFLLYWCFVKCFALDAFPRHFRRERKISFPTKANAIHHCNNKDRHQGFASNLSIQNLFLHKENGVIIEYCY